MPSPSPTLPCRAFCGSAIETLEYASRLPHPEIARMRLVDIHPSLAVISVFYSGQCAEGWSVVYLRGGDLSTLAKPRKCPRWM